MKSAVWLWPVLSNSKAGVWYWSLSQGELVGLQLSNPENDQFPCRITLGAADGFDVGFSRKRHLQILLQRPSDGSKRRLELIWPNGNNGRSMEILAEDERQFFPHFLPGRCFQAEGKNTAYMTESGPWEPGWLANGALYAGGERVTDVELADITWLAPTGAPAGGWWGFQGSSCDETSVAGILGPQQRVLWRAGPRMVPLAPGYSPDMKRLYYLAAFWRDNGRELGVVGRFWPQTSGLGRHKRWSNSRLLSSWQVGGSGELDLGQDVNFEESTSGGAISCPGLKEQLFWVPIGEKGGCFQDNFVRKSMQAPKNATRIVPLGIHGERLKPGPVRLRGICCPAAGENWECFSVGWGVRQGKELSVQSVPERCPFGQLIGLERKRPKLRRNIPLRLKKDKKGQFRNHDNEKDGHERSVQSDADSEETAKLKESVRKLEAKVRTMKRAMNASLKEVEKLRKENEDLMKFKEQK